MKNIFKIFLALITIGTTVSCDFDDDFTPPNYVAFDLATASTQVAIGGTTTYDVTVYTGNVVNTDRTFDIVTRSSSSLSSGAYTLPSTVTVPGGSNEASFIIDIADVNMNPNGGNLVLGLVPQAGLPSGRNFSLNVTWSCDTPLKLDFVFDGYASETSWNVADTEGNILLEGAGFEDGTAAASIERCLPNGDYVFTIFDTFGDGLTFPEVGSATVSYAGVELAVIPGDFGAEASVEFTIE